MLQTMSFRLIHMVCGISVYIVYISHEDAWHCFFGCRCYTSVKFNQKYWRPEDFVANFEIWKKYFVKYVISLKYFLNFFLLGSLLCRNITQFVNKYVYCVTSDFTINTWFYITNYILGIEMKFIYHYLKVA